MRKALLVLALIFGMTGLAQAQQKQSLSAAASTCTTTGTSCLIYLVDASSGGATFTVSANASGNTLQFEATGDGGQTWVALNATPSNSTTAATSTTGTGTWQANVAGYTGVRIRMSTLSGGTSTVSIITSLASARAGGGGGGGGGVTSFSGDGTVITNSASTGAVTATIAGTSGGIPCFNSATTWESSGAITSGDVIQGGGAGACAADSGVAASNVVQLTKSSTQTLQCTGAITCLILKQSSGGGDPLIVQSSGGTAQFTIAPGASFPVTSNQAFAALAVGNSVNSHVWISNTAPTVSAAGCGGSAASITSNNGTAAFKVNVGTSNTGTCTITMPATTTDWVCSATDITRTTTTVSTTKSVPGGTPTTQITLQNYTDVSGTAAWTDSDVIAVSCMGE